MLLVGSDDGVYRVPGPDDSSTPETEKVLNSGRVMRLREFKKLNGVFAATRTGLYRSQNGIEWIDLGVPQEKVYSVSVGSAGNRLYAGTRPAHIYVGDLTKPTEIVWNELDEFQELPSRDEWRLPRHENLAQVRDLHTDPAVPDRLVAGVEVGGVHLSNDGGKTWTERSEGVDSDIHEFHVVGPEEYVAATGHGLYRTTDAGQSWSLLDEAAPQSYFRSVHSINGVIYASGALSNSSTWDDDNAEPALFTYHNDTLESIEIPYSDETVTGMTTDDGNLLVATHRGNLLVNAEGDWSDVSGFPVSGRLTGRYTPVTFYNG